MKGFKRTPLSIKVQKVQYIDGGTLKKKWFEKLGNS